MAGRNRRNTADYFSHDADASSDEKIIYLESKFGLIGYALYFKLLETMTRADNFELHWDEIKISIYSSKFGISVTEIERFITECCRKEIKAFILEDQRLYSPGLKSRMQPLLEKREYNRKKYTEKINNKTNNLPISVTKTPLKVTEMTQSKVKESKVKESKVKESKEESKGKKKNETTLSPDFIVSDRVKKWAKDKNFANLDDHLESFKLKCKAKGYTYIDWDAAFMTAIREDWGKIRGGNNGQNNGRLNNCNGKPSVSDSFENKEYISDIPDISGYEDM